MGLKGTRKYGHLSGHATVRYKSGHRYTASRKARGAARAPFFLSNQGDNIQGLYLLYMLCCRALTKGKQVTEPGLLWRCGQFGNQTADTSKAANLCFGPLLLLSGKLTSISVARRRYPFAFRYDYTGTSENGVKNRSELLRLRCCATVEWTWLIGNLVDNSKFSLPPNSQWKDPRYWFPLPWC